MTVLYLETSALLSWLFDEPHAQSVIDAVNGADLIVTSELIRIETSRAIKRVHREGLLTQKECRTLQDLFGEIAEGWFRMTIDESIIAAASEEFPVEPVRSLDAIHLATALECKKLYPDLKMLTFDERILQNKAALLL